MLGVVGAGFKNRGDTEVAEFSRREKAAELNQRFDDAEDDAETTAKKPQRNDNGFHHRGHREHRDYIGCFLMFRK